jgi:hypothetical protein
MHANIGNHAAFPHQRLTHIKRRRDAHRFHHDVEAVDFGIEDLAGCGANVGDLFGRAGVDRIRARAGQHAFRELEASFREVEEGDATGRVEGGCEACGETYWP